MIIAVILSAAIGGVGLLLGALFGASASQIIMIYAGSLVLTTAVVLAATRMREVTDPDGAHDIRDCDRESGRPLALMWKSPRQPTAQLSPGTQSRNK